MIKNFIIFFLLCDQIPWTVNGWKAYVLSGVMAFFLTMLVEEGKAILKELKIIK